MISFYTKSFCARYDKNIIGVLLCENYIATIIINSNNFYK